MIDARPGPEEPVSLLDVVRRHRRVAAGMVLLVAVGAAAYHQLLKPPAIAESRVVVDNPRSDASGVGAANPVEYFASQLALARLPTVTDEALASTGIAADTSTVRISSDPGSDTIVFTTSLPEGNAAASLRLTNAIVANYVNLSQAARRAQAQASLQAVTASLQVLARSRGSDTTASTSLRTQLTARETALAEEAQTPSTQLTVSPAESQPSGVPGVTRLTLTLLLGGVLLAVSVALLRDGGDRLLTHAADAASATGLPILALLPLARRDRAAAHATWTALTPPGGLLLVAVAENGLDGYVGTAGGDDPLVELLGPAEPHVLLVTLPVLRADFDTASDAEAPVVLIAGPRTSVTALREACDDLNRARLTLIGLLWAEPSRDRARLRARFRRTVERAKGGRSSAAGSLRRPRGAVAR